LTDLMFEHDIGVTRVETYELKRIDGDYYENS
jgi:restriction endonuclease Mrr